MPRPRDPERADFMRWVEHRKSVKTRSAETYARRAWALRAKTEEARPVFLAEQSPSMRGDYLTAWRLYQAWSRARKRPAPPIRLPKVPACPLPRHVMEAIFAVLITASGLGAHRMARLSWADVQREGPAGRWTVRVEGTEFHASSEHLKLLEFWGAPEGVHAPVVPERPRSLSFIHPYYLTSWVHRHRSKGKR